MTDADVVQAAAELMSSIGGRPLLLSTRSLPSGKTAFDARTTGLPAAKIMWIVLPYMGHRRAAMIRTILTGWAPKKYKEAVAFRQSLDLEAA